MSINTYFDKIFCINLDRRPDRWALCLQEFEKYGITNFERVPGIDRPGDGTFGCTLTHRILLRKIAAGPWARVLILEDDFHFLTSQDFVNGGHSRDASRVQLFHEIPETDPNARFDLIVEHVPYGWNVLYLGGAYSEPPIARVDKHVIRCASFGTTGSYGITREFAGTVSTWIDAITSDVARVLRIDKLDIRCPDIDYLFGMLGKNINNKFYVLSPRLIVQREGPSDTGGARVVSLLDHMTDDKFERMAR